MQASLPKMVRMVSVDDIGQGSESIRILGVRWLPTGAAAKSVSKDGSLKKNSENDKSTSDRSVPGEGNIKDDTGAKDEDEDGQDDGIAEGMEAEEGDFVNMEIAFAYRPSAGRKRMKDRAKRAHLYMAFYLPSNVKLRKYCSYSFRSGVQVLCASLWPFLGSHTQSPAVDADKV
jgi:hypothetical protein